MLVGFGFMFPRPWFLLHDACRLLFPTVVLAVAYTLFFIHDWPRWLQHAFFLCFIDSVVRLVSLELSIYIYTSVVYK
jgi:hypothetical protein